MIGGAVHGGGGAQLGRHMVNTDHNEDVRAGSSRGLMAEDVMEQVAELTELAEATGHKSPLRHIYASPPPGSEWGEKEWGLYWTLYERAQGLEGRAYSESIHDKPGNDDRPPHRHRIYLAITERGTLVRTGHDYAKQEAVSRITEFDTGTAFVKGKHNIRAERIARQLGRDDVANAMVAAGLLNGSRPCAPLTPSQRAQQERTDISKQDVAAMVAAAWHASDSPQAFANALREKGMAVAQGDKKAVPVIVDSSGNTHGLRQMLGLAARGEGSPAPKAENINIRMAGISLPSVAEARLAIHDAHITTAVEAMVPLIPEPPPADAAPVTAPVSEPPTAIASDAIKALAVVSDTPAAEPSHNAISATPPLAGAAAIEAEPQLGGVSLDDPGEGPGEPPGPGAGPDELARYRVALAAYQDRKAAAWASWVASQQKAQPTPSAKSSGEEHAHTQPHANIHHAPTITDTPWRDDRAGGCQSTGDICGSEGWAHGDTGGAPDIAGDGPTDRNGKHGLEGYRGTADGHRGQAERTGYQAFQHRIANARAARGLATLNVTTLLDRLQPERAADRAINAALDDLECRRRAIAAESPMRRQDEARAQLQAVLDLQQDALATPAWCRWVPWTTRHEAEHHKLAQDVATAHAQLAAAAPDTDELRHYRIWREDEGARLDKEGTAINSIIYAVSEGDTDIVRALVRGGMEAARRLYAERWAMQERAEKALAPALTSPDSSVVEFSGPRMI